MEKGDFGDIKVEVIIKSSYNEICQEAARIIMEEWQKKRNLVLGLATGATPLGVYKKIIELHQKGEIDFTSVVTFNLDEYLGLPPSHPQSYRAFMQKNLFDHININPQNGVRMSQGGVPEYFYEENPPGDTATVVGGERAGGGKASEEIKEQLF